MSEEVIEEPQIEAPPPPPVVKKKHVIQPHDKEGREIGSPHVYYYTDDADLARQLTDSVANGTRKIRELALGTPIKLVAPDEADFDEVEDEAIPEFKPRELTADERFSITNKLRDPATVVEGFEELTIARTGAKPEDIAKLQSKTAKDAASARMDARITRGKAEAISFNDAHPEFVPNQANANAMTSWLNSHKGKDGRPMAWTLKNFELAFKALTTDGLLILREPEPEKEPEAPKVVPEPVSEPRTEEPVTTRTRGTADLPSSIKPSDSSPSTSVRSNRPSAASVAMMNKEQLKKALEKWPDLLTRR